MTLGVEQGTPSCLLCVLIINGMSPELFASVVSFHSILLKSCLVFLAGTPASTPREPRGAGAGCRSCWADPCASTFLPRAPGRSSSSLTCSQVRAAPGLSRAARAPSTAKGCMASRAADLFLQCQGNAKLDKMNPSPISNAALLEQGSF